MKMFRYYWKYTDNFRLRSPLWDLNYEYGYPTEGAAVKAYNDSGLVSPLVLIKQYEDVPDDVLNEEQILEMAEQCKKAMEGCKDGGIFDMSYLP
jgi:hypothetical protein